MEYKPFTTDYTPLIIDDMKEYLKRINNSEATIDTLDLCHLIGEIERLNNIINELEKWIDEEILDYDKNIHFSKVHKVPIVEHYEREKICFRDFKYKIKELKGSDKE